jgi:NADH-quinone oxidoreductase subunit F
MEFIPHLLIEGMITQLCIGCKPIYIYIHGEYMWVYKILERAINEKKAAGFLGKNILGSGYDLELYVHCGAGAYICGEETAFESLEGKEEILVSNHLSCYFRTLGKSNGCNNVETIAAVPWLIIQVRNMLKLVLVVLQEQINFSQDILKNQVFMKLNWV